MYLLFKGVSDKELFGIQRIGDFNEYVVGILDDSIKGIVKLEHLRFSEISEDVALCYKFAGLQRDYLKVRFNDVTDKPDFSQIVESAEIDPENESKVRYNLSADDISNTVKFLQTYMRLRLDDVYDNRMRNLNMNVSNLEFYSWEQQRKEAEIYVSDNTASVPLLQSLATSRGITISEMANKINTAVTNYYSSLSTLLSKKQLIEKEIKDCTTILECHVLLFNRYDITMVPARKIEAGIDENESSKYDL